MNGHVNGAHPTANLPPNVLAAIRVPPEGLIVARYVEIVDQLSLPQLVHWDRITSAREAFDAIRSMRIRGAPAIASLAALGLALDLLARQGVYESIEALQAHVGDLAAFLLTARPTAVNLREALDRIRAVSQQPASDLTTLLERVLETSVKVWSEDVERNHLIGDNGAEWLLDQLEATGAIRPNQKISVLTVCNTGSLATSGYGTALGMITSLWRLGRLEHAYYAQTGPYQQGARLTSLELHTLGIPSTMCLDTAVAALLSGAAGRQIHAFIAGADRVAANGDTANKISTLQISTLCHAVPASVRPRVIICAPLTTLDLGMATGASIHIEIRAEIEAKTVRGRLLGSSLDDEGLHTVQFVPDFARVWNPAFDVTSADLIDVIVTEVGVAAKQKGQATFELVSWVQSRQTESKHCTPERIVDQD